MPRVLIICETGTREPATFMCIIGGRVLACCTVPKSMYSDLSEFNTNSLQQNQAYRSHRQSSTRDMFDNAVATETVMYICVSSANCWWEMAWSDIILAIGEIYRVKKSGPRTEPWGTPILHGVWVDVEPPTQTNWERSDKYEVIHWRTSTSTPKLVFNLDMKISWSTRSNAALRSRATSNVDCDWSDAW